MPKFIFFILTLIIYTAYLGEFVLDEMQNLTELFAIILPLTYFFKQILIKANQLT